jgi:hypothetical protein
MKSQKEFPAEAKLSRVNGLLRLLSSNKGKLSIAQLSEMSKNNVDELLPQVNAAELLKLINVVDDDVIITKLGTQLRENDEEAIKKIFEELKKFEPFNTAYSLSKKIGMFKTENLADALAKKKIAFDIDKDKNINIINTMLFQWAIYFGVLDYYGADGRWIEER